MNKHLRALLIVGGLAAFVLGGFAAYKWQSQTSSEARTESLGAEIQLNQRLPDFEATTLDGKGIKLSQFQGKVVVVNFWASWCGPCIEEMPSLIRLLKAFPKEVELVAISGDSSREDIDSFLKSFPEMRTLPNIHLVWDTDRKLTQKYKIIRLPESFVLNKELKLVKKISGTIDWHTPDAIDYIKILLSSDQQPQANPSN